MKFTGGGFGGGAGGPNMQQMMKQAQKLQEQMQKAQEELETDTVTGTAGGGMVNAVMNGHKKLLAVSVKPEAADPGDVEMLEDLIMAAYNDAFDKAEELCKEKMGPLASLPFGMG